MTQWWSDSKGRYMTLDEMPNKQVANARKKLLRGEYVPPGEPLSADEETRLGAELEAELERRNCDLDGNDATPPPTDDDAPKGEEL